MIQLLEFEELYKDETLVSKKYWDLNGQSIVCGSLEMTDSERYRTFKEK